MDSDFSIASLGIKRIIETSSVEETNLLIEKQWHLLNCYTSNGVNVNVLGLPSEIGVNNNAYTPLD